MSALPSWTERPRAAPILCLLATALTAAQQPAALRVTVLEGNRAAHSLKSNTAATTVVEVRDATGAPVAGARVSFQTPASGPGGVFANGERQMAVQTNANGRAATIGFVPNSQPGEFPLQVSISTGGATERLTIWQKNSFDRFDDGVPAVKSGWKWWLAGLAAAGGVTGLTLLLRGGEAPARPGWTPGPPDIGAPR